MVEPLVMTLPELAIALRISRNLCYELARRNSLPVPVIRVGVRRMVVSRKAVEQFVEGGTANNSSSCEIGKNDGRAG